MKAPAFCFALISFFTLSAPAQLVIPAGISSAPHSQSNPDPSPPTYNTGAAINYVRTFNALKPTIDATQLNTSSPPADVQVQTLYADGLGRTLQTVSKAASPLGKDLVIPVTYDAFGRESYNYLPYTATSTDGQLKTSPFTAQATFLQNQYSAQGELFFYGKTEFEASPLNRPLKTMAPGNSWIGSGREVTNTYESNAANEVILWSIGFMAGGQPLNAGYYNAGELYRTITTDEGAKRTVEYKDKEGQIILKKVEIGTTGASISSHTGWLCTYYVYDGMGNLRFVLPPKAVEQVLLGTPVASFASELCFRYEYDHHNRMILKKVPGAAEVYLVYDSRDRLVYTQDGNLRTQGATYRWLTTFYDALNRPVATGMLSYGSSSTAVTTVLQQLRDYAANTTNLTTASVSAQGGKLVSSLVLPNRTNGTNLYEASGSIEFVAGFESEPAADFTAQINTVSGTSATRQVVGITYPVGGSLNLLTQTFYDNYNDLTTVKAYATANNSKLDQGVSLYPEALPATRSIATKGLTTANRVWMMDDANDLSKGRWLESVNFFDNKGRVVQVQSDNVRGEVETLTTRYEFSGRAITTYQVHRNPASTAGEIRIKTNLGFDHQGRLLTIKKAINDGTAKVVVQNEYNELGQLKVKSLGTKPGTATPLETLNYEYTIRGWLKSINKDFATTVSNQTNYFGQTFSYDYGFSAPQYNGNIAGIQWRSRGDGEQRAYGFAYDGANRLLKADFTQYTGGWNNNAGVDFSVKMGDGVDPSSAYDANGNIKMMWQKGLKLGPTGMTSDWIDQLQYTYFANSNKLQTVVDGINDVATRLGDFHSSQRYMAALSNNKTAAAIDYGYDGNGNLITDRNKDMEGSTGLDQSSGGAITYNHLNLPHQIKVKNTDGTDKGTVTFIYDAAGNKLQKIVSEKGGSATTEKITTYMDGFVYEKSSAGDELQFFSHEEGRTRQGKDVSGNTTYAYDYFLKDHLGNVRTVLTEEVKPMGIYQASMEDGANGVETQLFANIAETREAKPANNEFDGESANQKVSRLFNASGTDKRVGPYVVLKVMAGDKFKVRVFGWYKAGQTDASQESGVSSIVSSLITAFSGVAPLASHTGSGVVSNANGVLNAPLDQFRGSQPTTVAGVPKAYLNYLVLDEQQLKLVSGNWGAVPVPTLASGQQKQLLQAAGGQEIEVKKNGYLFVYLSNESKGSVYFDDLRVELTQGPLMEETHYYPFGLVMSGISSKAANITPNKEQTFQGQRFDDDLGLNWVQFKWRNHDPQIGRFIEIDPLSEKYVYNSTYAFSENRVIDGRKLEGLEWVSAKDDKGVTTSRQLTVSITNSSKLNEKQFNKLVESFKSEFSKTYGSDGAKAELIISDKSTFKVDVVDQTSTPTTDADGNDAKKFQGGLTAKLGETQENSFSVTASVDGEKRGNSEIARSFNHEAGHSAGLRHSFDPNQELTDIKQGAPGVKTSTITNNLMNSDANKDNPSSTGTTLLKSQLGSIDKVVQSQQPKKTE